MNSSSRFVVLVVAFLISCISPSGIREQGDGGVQSSYETSSPHIQRLDSLFAVGCSQFDSSDCGSALAAFEQIILTDTSFVHYEAYAFAAECYQRRGTPERGFSLYDSLEQRYSRRATQYSSKSGVQIALEEIREMKAMYPRFPAFLLKENGFVLTDSMPRVLTKKEPQYPLDELRGGVQGDVYLTVRLSGLGTIDKVTIDSAATRNFAVAALEALKGWRFSPMKRKGRLSKCEITIPFRFRLSNR